MPSLSESEVQVFIHLCIEEAFSSVLRVHLLKFKCCQISRWCSLISRYCPPKKGQAQNYILGCFSFGHWLVQLSMRLCYTIIIIVMLKTTFNFIKHNHKWPPQEWICLQSLYLLTYYLCIGFSVRLLSTVISTIHCIQAVHLLNMWFYLR